MNWYIDFFFVFMGRTENLNILNGFFSIKFLKNFWLCLTLNLIWTVTNETGSIGVEGEIHRWIEDGINEENPVKYLSFFFWNGYLPLVNNKESDRGFKGIFCPLTWRSNCVWLRRNFVSVLSNYRFWFKLKQKQCTYFLILQITEDL